MVSCDSRKRRQGSEIGQAGGMGKQRSEKRIDKEVRVMDIIQ